VANTTDGGVTLDIMIYRPKLSATVDIISSYVIRLRTPKTTQQNPDQWEKTYTLAPLAGEEKIVRSIPLSAFTDAGNTPAFTGAEVRLAVNVQAIASTSQTDPDVSYTSSDWWTQDQVFPPPFSLLSTKTNPGVGVETQVSTTDLPDVIYRLNSNGEPEVLQLDRVKFTPDVQDTLNSGVWRTYYTGMNISVTYDTPGVKVLAWAIAADFQSSDYSVYLVREAYLTEEIKQADILPRTGFNSWIGAGSATGFEFSDPGTATFNPGGYVVMITGAAVSERTREVKMFLATSRTADASTYYQTVAWDLFPVPGRYKVPSFSPSIGVIFDATRTWTDASLYAPLKITDFLLNTLKVGYDYNVKLDTQGGLPPYAYYAKDLPPGLKLTAQGEIIGSPQQVGLFQTQVSVVDSEYPPQIDIKTLTLYIETDLEIDNPGFQRYYIDTPSYTQVTAHGGVQPYSWQMIDGISELQKFGLTFTAYGTIEGTPYDRGKEHLPYIFPVTVQVEDAVGNLATTTFDCGVYPPHLKIMKRKLDEMFDGETSVQRIYAIGGDNQHYNWTIESLGDTPLPPYINFTTVGNPAVLSLDPNDVIRGTEDGHIEAFYRVRIMVQSGSANYVETDQQDFDLVISNALSDVTIKDDVQLDPVVPGQTFEKILSLFVPDNSTADKRKLPITCSSPNKPPFTAVSSAGVITGAPVAAGQNFWFRVLVQGGRTPYFKDFHITTANDPNDADPTLQSQFTIICRDSFQNSELGNSNVTAIGWQHNTVHLHNNDLCTVFDVFNSETGLYVRDDAVFSLEDPDSLPKGCSFSSLGFIYGVPVEAGQFDFVVNATIDGVAIPPYKATMFVNPASAAFKDLLHDVRLALDRQPVAVIISPQDGAHYQYGSQVNVTGSAYDPDQMELKDESFTYEWDLGDNSSHVFVQNPGLITLLNQTRAVEKRTFRLRVADSFGVFSGDATDESDWAHVTILVDTQWFRTASNRFDQTGQQAPDESLTDGIPQGQPGSTNIDLLGS
jgi:hypothetical protein